MQTKDTNSWFDNCYECDGDLYTNIKNKKAENRNKEMCKGNLHDLHNCVNSIVKKKKKNKKTLQRKNSQQTKSNIGRQVRSNSKTTDTGSYSNL